MTYPESKKVDQVDDYHGTSVRDPYRWLEDLDSAETKAWIEAQNKLTSAYLKEIQFRDQVRQRLTKLWNYERFGAPFKEGGRYFFSKNDGLQNQSVLYTMDHLSSEPRVLLDPNTLSPDGTIAVTDQAVSHDGKLLAYGIAGAGSDWQEWNVRDVASGEDLDDHVQWVKFSVASWTRDSKGFFYSRYDQPKPGQEMAAVNYFHKLFYHRIGLPQSQDELFYERKDQKEWGFSGSVTEDGRYLIIHVFVGTEVKNRVFYKDLQSNGDVVELLNDFDAQYYFVDNDGPVFCFVTNQNAPRGRFIAIDTRNPDRANWRELISETNQTLDSVSVVGNQLIASYLKDAHTQVKIFTLEAEFVREVGLPGIGAATGFRGKRGDPETFYYYTSFTQPGAVYRYDSATGENSIFKQPDVPFNLNDYETQQVFLPSKDGTLIPMFVTHKKGLPLNGQNPTVLYGYGGFNISVIPWFSVQNLQWMEMGGVFAVANLRGGGEYGETWHEAGMKSRKQNVFDDFIAAAEWLIANKYTSTPELAISGSSNGGLLVGACLIQRPELFGAAVADVAVLDMLRFHKFTIGWAWVSDYGSPDNPDEFEWLYAYSPYHNLKRGTRYPATLITTADHDDRVVPAHSFKFASAMQAAQSGPAPILIRIETRAGHGVGKPTAKLIEEAADVLSFLAKELRVQV